MPRSVTPFRAGRNLPVKEFRYLRTVIVTAAVYWGFNSGASPKLTLPFNLPAPGRRQPLYFILRFSRNLCFDKQSPGPFSLRLVLRLAPLLPKLRGHFAEFLNARVHSPTLDSLLDYLCRFAVRAVKYSLEAFLGSVTSATSLL